VIRYLIAKCWSLFAIVTIAAAVMLTLVRVLLPYVDEYQSEIQTWLRASLEQSVSFSSVEAQWKGLGPSFTFKNILFRDKVTGQTLVNLDEASVAIDIPASLFSNQLQLGSLTVVGAGLSVLKRSDGRFEVEGFSGLGQGAASSEDRGQLLDWLLMQEKLALEGSTLLWRDENHPGQALRFIGVNLQLRNDGEHHQFDGFASLPSDIGKRFVFAVDLSGDMLSAKAWSGKAYVSGVAMQLGEMLGWLPLSGVSAEKGIADISLWSDWQQGELQQLEGDVSIRGTLLVRDEEKESAALPEFLDTLSGRFFWHRDTTGWALAIDDFNLGRWGDVWPAGAIRVKASSEKDQQQFEFSSDYIRIDDIVALLRMSDFPEPALRDALAGLQPSGVIKQAHVRYNKYLQSAEYFVSGDVEDISVQPWKKIPGISGLDGFVVANQDSGMLKIDSRDMNVDLRPLFRNDHYLKRFEGQLLWQQNDAGWLIAARELNLKNADISMRADVDFELPSDGRSPYLKVSSGFIGEPGSVSNTSRYLPVGIMRPSVVKWLDQAIVGGTVSNGGLIFQGRLKRFPFDLADGKFEVRFALHDGLLNYFPKWPRLEELETEVIFAGRGMLINGVAGKLLGADMLATQVSIANLKAKPAILKINGKVSGATGDALDYIASSPLKKRFGSYLGNAEAQGLSDLDLSLTILLKPKGVPNTVELSGTMSLENSELLIANKAVDISQLNGEIQFTENSLSAKGISGKVLGLPASFSIATLGEGSSVHTQISASGASPVVAITELLKVSLFDHFKGDIDWQAALLVPGKDSRLGADLTITSNLLGLETHLPAPLHKAATEEMPLNVLMRFPLTPERPTQLKIDGLLTAALGFDEQLKLQRGNIRLGDGLAEISSEQGLWLTGTSPVFSLSEWLPFLEKGDAEDVAGTGVAPAPNSKKGIDRIEMKIADVEAYGYHFSDVTAKLLQTPKMLDVNLDSALIAGRIQVPMIDGLPLVMDMQRLQLIAVDESEQSQEIKDPKISDPSELPAAQIKSEQFSYHGIDFGQLDIVATKHLSGLKFTHFNLQSPDMVISGRGDWVMADNSQYSSFSLDFSSENFGKALSQLGYVGSVNKGKGALGVSARWPGSPASFALERLSGNINMKVEDGSLLELEPGAGRIFGLLSLQALPRRLILDFRDFFQKGFRFDRITGDFDINDGLATTPNLSMKGPAGSIDVRGEIDLVERSYAQVATVMPEVSTGLPVAGAVVSGVGVGAAILLVQKILKPKIEDIARIEYSITGSWDEPVIERINEK